MSSWRATAVRWGHWPPPPTCNDTMPFPALLGRALVVCAGIARFYADAAYHSLDGHNQLPKLIHDVRFTDRGSRFQAERRSCSAKGAREGSSLLFGDPSPDHQNWPRAPKLEPDAPDH